ncbi:hypothetical protein, partial [Kitasatospora aureofaciens]|uniref:hypothetical protein n=1 Tax=Kitasatospora aureofaciens TaxID=1894 RepID=UPI001FD1231C
MHRHLHRPKPAGRGHDLRAEPVKVWDYADICRQSAGRVPHLRLEAAQVRVDADLGSHGPQRAAQVSGDLTPGPLSGAAHRPLH